MTTPTPPLAGVRVLDLSRVLAGPYCAMVLADLGADVIKVERPGSGDTTRAWGPPFAAGESAYYLCVNRGKRSVAVDLADERGREVVQRLAREADVVIENFLPGGADKLGIGASSLLAERPSLVVCSIVGYPDDGPDAGRPGFDFAIQAEGGIMSVTGVPDGDPMKVGVAVSDITTGMFAAIGVLAALREVEATGRGRHVEVSLFDSQLAWLANRASEWLVAGEEPARLGNAHPTIVPYEGFRALDGHVVVALGTDAQFRRFCDEAGLGELAADARFTTNPDRVRNREPLCAALAAAIAERPVAHWVDAVQRAGVPGGPVRTIREVFEHAPMTTVEHEHPTIGTMRTVRSPLGFDGTRPTACAHPPLLGEHTAEVLGELGYGGDDLASLLAGPCRAV